VVASNRVLARALILVAVTLSLPSVARSQVGISSGLTQITLVARVAPHGSIKGVSAERETGRMGGLREASTTVRLSANAGYRLVVKAAGTPSSRVWVRAVTGEFQELTAGSSVTVARGTQAVESEREVQYRIESAGDELGLPVRYELAIAPQI
jgi:hypothetical protein